MKEEENIAQQSQIAVVCFFFSLFFLFLFLFLFFKSFSSEGLANISQT